MTADCDDRGGAPAPHVVTGARGGGWTRAASAVDPVLAVMALAFAGLSILDPAQALESLVFTAESLAWISPFLLLAVGIAAYVRAARADTLITRAFAGRVAPMIVAAALFGALSPFCSCGVIPLVGALLSMGMPLPAVMAFWLASPIMDPEVFVLTAGGLGLGFAIAKTIAAAGIGVAGGFATLAVSRLGGFEAPLKSRPGGCAVRGLTGAEAVRWRFWREDERRRAFVAEGASNAWFLIRWLTLAFLLESLMLAWMPADLIGAWLGGGNLLAVPTAAIVGAPAYLNSYAAIPTTAALIELGMTPGAALAFMTAGAVTSIPAAVAVYALVRRSVFAAYVGFGLVGSMLAGYAYQLWLG